MINKLICICSTQQSTYCLSVNLSKIPTCVLLHLSPCPHVYLPTRVPIFMPICPLVHLFTGRAVYLSIFLPVYLATCLPAYLSTFIHVYMSPIQPVHFPNCLLIYLFIFHLFIIIFPCTYIEQ